MFVTTALLLQQKLLLLQLLLIGVSCRITNTETYHKYSQNLIIRSQVERESSEKLRSDIDCFLRTSAKEMWNRFNQVNTAILARIQEVTNARNRLQIQLEKVWQLLHAITATTIILILLISLTLSSTWLFWHAYVWISPRTMWQQPWQSKLLTYYVLRPTQLSTFSRMTN